MAPGNYSLPFLRLFFNILRIFLNMLTLKLLCVGSDPVHQKEWKPCFMDIYILDDKGCRVDWTKYCDNNELIDLFFTAFGSFKT